MLRGKSMIVTGGGRGLGRAYALAIGAAGGAVVVNDVDSEAAAGTAADLRSRGVDAISVSGSVEDWDVTRSIVEACVEAFGRVDGVVNNAAITRHAAPWDESQENLRAVLGVNVLGPQFVARHAMRAMVNDARGGSIINIVSGARLGIVGMSSYGASKGAVDAMTHNWAREGRSVGIRVNAISPLAQTQMATADTRGNSLPLPDPEMIAPLVVALLSDDLKDVTGVVLRYDGQRLAKYSHELETVASQTIGWSADELIAVLVQSGREPA